MAAGFPEGTPLRRAMNFTYNHVAALQFLRTTYKAGPLLALGLACLGGPGARARLRGCGGARAGRPPRAGGAGRAGRAAAGRWCAARRSTRSSTWDADPAGVEGGRRPRGPHGRPRRARGGAPRPAVRLLRLGRDRRRDPARARRAPGGRALRRAVRRPARGRPAVDGRRAGAAAPRAARPARPAARPAGRARPWSAGADDDRSPQRRRRRRATPPTCSTSSAPPDRAWGPVRAEPRAAGHARARPRPLPRVRAWDRPRRAAAGARRGASGRRRWSTARPTASPGLAAFGALPAPG